MLKFLKPMIFLSGLLLIAFTATAQPLVKWQFGAKRLNATTYQFTAKGTLPKPWHAYAANSSADGSTTPTIAYEYEKVAAVNAIILTGNSVAINDPVFSNKKTNVYEREVTVTQQVKINGTIPASLKGTVTVYTASGQGFYPLEQPFDVPLEGGAALASNNDIKIASVDIAKPIANCGVQEEKQSSLWGIFLLGFAGGLVALLTPCVFPMIPFTVSYFTRSSTSRKAAIRNGFIYGLFIFLIYILLSVPFHIAGNVNPEIFNTISTNAWLNLIFFAIFMFFALSFFGFFEITLPGSLANKADEKSGLGNIGGIFFMSLTLALVSFSCTGPILGSLLVGSLGNGAWPLTAGLAGFGVALGLPFGLFAIFPGLLKALPKSGGWLDTVKKVLAFVEVALALKFLSNADLVMHWGILKREVFIGVWLLISLGLAAYLFGLIRLPHDTKGQKIAPIRKVLGAVALLFCIYLAPGVAPAGFASLDLLSGFPPPLSYSVYEKSHKDGKALEADVVNDYSRAMALSDSLHKPVLIDFTGWACVNCRKMEENVWNKPEVKSYIEQNFVLVSLYVDDRKKLPVLERQTYTTRDNNKKDLITQGDKWATFESENFGQVSQPYYAILNHEAKLLNSPVGYTPDAKEYLNWLKCAKASFDRVAVNE